jgi:predicted nuclease of predicted toxin-antitoxin system
MTFFLDENFPCPAQVWLKASGHAAKHALDIFPQGTADAELFARAQEERSIFVTTDKDFFHTIPLAFAHHHGAIVVALRRPNRAGLFRRLADALALLGERDFQDTVWLVTDNRIRSRHLPEGAAE